MAAVHRNTKNMEVLKIAKCNISGKRIGSNSKIGSMIHVNRWDLLRIFQLWKETAETKSRSGNWRGDIEYVEKEKCRFVRT